MSYLLTQIIIVLCVVALLTFFVVIVYVIRFLKEYKLFKTQVQQLKNQQQKNRQTIAMMKRKIIEVETTPLFGKRTKRVLEYKNKATSIASFRKKQKIKKIEKQKNKSKARQVHRKVCKKHGK